MAPKGGTIFLLLIVICAAMGKRPSKCLGNGRQCKGNAREQIRKCQEKGYFPPKIEQLRAVFNGSDSGMTGNNFNQSSAVLRTYADIMESVSPGSISRFPLGDKKPCKKWNCSNLSTMIRQMRNLPEASACYMRAIVACPAWNILTGQSENNTNSCEIDELLGPARSALADMKLSLPSKPPLQIQNRIMMVLRDESVSMPERKKKDIAEWMKQQLTQKTSNCTMRPSSDAKLKKMPLCKWLTSEGFDMLGPLLAFLAPEDVDFSPKEQFCEFFRSGKMKSYLCKASEMKPSLAKKLLQRCQACFDEKKFTEHLDKLGTLVCQYMPPKDLTRGQSRKLLEQFNNCNVCNNPRNKKIKSRLTESLTPKNVKALSELGSSVLQIPNPLPGISWDDLKQLRNLNVSWTCGQQRALAKGLMGKKKLKESSEQDLKALEPVAAGLPSYVLQYLCARGILTDKATKTILKCGNGGKIKALLQWLRKGSSDMVQKLNDSLACSVSLSDLKRAKINSLEQVKDKTWCRPQAFYLIKKLNNGKPNWKRRMRSLLQGVTCEMINKTADSDLTDMFQAITEDSRWLSRVQAMCAARKYWMTKMKDNPDYLKNISEDELEMTPILFILYLPPEKVKDLAVSVCDVFLDGMEKANLTWLPVRARRSRQAFLRKALSCLENNLSKLTTENVTRLGQLICELTAAEIRLMAPDVQRFTLKDMASCQHIAQGNAADLIQLVKEKYGDPSNWTIVTMEELGRFLLLDDDAISALPNKPWMLNVLYFLSSRVRCNSDALKKKIFDLVTTSNEARKKREASSNNGPDTNTDPNAISATGPTVERIGDLDTSNVCWEVKDLDQMSDETFRGGVETLGKVPNFSPDKQAVLARKAIKIFGPVSEMNETVVRRLGCIILGFSSTDLEKLPISLDDLEYFAKCSWNDSQMKPAWRAIAKYNNLEAQQLDEVEMVDLSRFICGLNSSEIEQLNPDAFKEAVGSLDEAECSNKVMQDFKIQAVSVYGDPSNWTEAEVSELKNIIAGLDENELASLDPSVFPYISQSCIPLIPPKNFAALSLAQLKSLGPDNAAAVTRDQQAALSKEQREALESAMTGEDRQSSEESGAPSLTVMGISAVMKPLLFLFTGFLLL